MKKILDSPTAYLFFQALVGGMRMRKRSLQEYASLFPGMRVLDIGCGPGYVLDYFPECDFVGFDTDQRYIDFAQKKYSDRGTFHCREFTRDALDELGKFDLVMLNGLLHHLDDQQAVGVLTVAKEALKPNGQLNTLDCCYVKGQSAVAKFMADNDRGQFVRTPEGYLALVEQVFETIVSFVNHDFSIVPNTVFNMVCKPDVR